MLTWAVLVFAPLAISCLLAGALLCDNALHVRRVPRGRPSLPRDHSTIPVTARAADGVILRGWFITAQNPNGRCVVLLHGIGDTSGSGQGLATLLVSHDYGVLLPDSRAHGASGGDLATYGFMEAGDLSRWLDVLSARGCGVLYAYGASMGAGVLLQSLRQEKRFKAVIAESSFSDFPEIARHRIRSFQLFPEPLNGWAAYAVVFSGLGYARLRYSLDLAAVSPAAAVAGVETPVLLIHGDRDTNIPPEHSAAIMHSNPRFQLWLVHGASHTDAMRMAPEEFRRRVLEWFDRHP